MRPDVALLIDELTQAQRLDAQREDVLKEQEAGFWRQLLAIHQTLTEIQESLTHAQRETGILPNQHVSVEKTENISVGFRCGALHLSFEASRRTLGGVCMYRINSQGRSDSVHEFSIIAEVDVRNRVLEAVRNHLIPQTQQDEIKKLGGVPSDLAQLARDVRSSREMEGKLVEEKKRRQLILEKTLADVQIWLNQLVEDLQDLARSDPKHFNPDNYPLKNVARMLELDPNDGVGFMFNGVAIKFKPVDGMMYMDAGSTATNTMVTDPVETTIRAVALKAVRQRLAPQSFFTQASSSFSGLLEG